MIAFALSLMVTAAAAPPLVPWRPWGGPAFEQARCEHKLVLLEVEAVWCHWCHVQDETTYRDPAVVAALGRHFVPIKVDQDAQPSLSERYARWGWPAIVVLTAEGQEVAIHRGYAEPAEMLAFLKQSVADPRPRVGSEEPAAAPNPDGGGLSESQRQELMRRDLDAYDARWGGWGDGHKTLDADELELALLLAERGDSEQAKKARQTLDAAHNLLDPVWGGVAQYSATPDWETPHVERLLAVQGDALFLYARALALFGRPADRDAAEGVARYLQDFLTASDGALFVSQDADLSAAIPGPRYYAQAEGERRRLGIPRIDTHVYSSQTALGALGLLALADATGEAPPLEAARRAIAWLQSHRAVEGGGFRHGDEAQASLALADTLNVGRALLALYGSTGERPYLEAAAQAASFIAAHFDAGDQGAYTAEPPGTAHLLASPYVSEEDNASLARFANLLFQYTGDPAHRAIADRAMRYLARADTIGTHGLHGEILLADRELGSAPLHITVVGSKSDPVAYALFRQARRTPVSYLRTDWLDPHGPPLPHLEVTFPPLGRAAAFVCDATTCSLPMTSVEQLRRKLQER